MVPKVVVELFFVCKVLWADGRKSWLREENLPVKVKNKVTEERERYEQQLMSLREMRQDRLLFGSWENFVPCQAHLLLAVCLVGS